MDDVARVAAMHRSLARLRGPERDVLALCAWSGLSYAEAAEALGIPVGTVRPRPCSYATGVNCFPDNPWPVTAQSVQVQESWTGQRLSQGFLTRNPGGTVSGRWARPRPGGGKAGHQEPGPHVAAIAAHRPVPVA